MNRQPRPIREEIERTTRVHYDSSRKQWYATNPIENIEIIVCGAVLQDGTRCKEPLDDKRCTHKSDDLLLVLENQPTTLVGIMKLLTQGDGKNNSILASTLELAENLDSESLSSLTQEVKVAYAIMFTFVKGKMDANEPLSNKDLDSLLNVLKEVSKIKELNSRINSQGKLDDSAAMSFVTEIVGVLKSELDPEIFKAVTQTLYHRVILPRQAAKAMNSSIRVTDFVDANTVE